jgi:two-component system LytT family response regulator
MNMEPIRVVIADDDMGMRLIEKKMIERVEGFALAGEATDGEELLRLVEEEHPQVVFLDVEMPGKTGVECARLIQDMDPAILLIFATAHDQYMGEAFEVYAFDYLVKPCSADDLSRVLEDALRALTGEEPEITLRVSRVPVTVPCSRILSASSRGQNTVW